MIVAADEVLDKCGLFYSPFVCRLIFYFYFCRIIGNCFALFGRSLLEWFPVSGMDLIRVQNRNGGAR